MTLESLPEVIQVDSNEETLENSETIQSNFSFIEAHEITKLHLE